jgi:hypothetical protein
VNNEDSTLFSLDKLTKGDKPTKGTPAPSQNARDEDSGLIDLERLTRSTTAQPTFVAAAPPPLRPFDVKPTLGGPVEESTLSGMSAFDARRSEPSRWRVPLYAAFVLAAAAAFAFAFGQVLSDPPQVTPPAQTIVVLAAPPPVVNDEPRASDRTAVPVSSAAGTAKPEAAGDPPPRVSRPRNGSVTTPPRPRTDAPKPPDPGQKPAKPKDPCAHCGGDLSCAMRCSVRGSG